MDQKKKGQWRGHQYHKNSAPQYEGAMEALSTLVLVGNERILDIGCGTGAISAEIAQRLEQGSILGTDLSASMIACAQETFADIENLSFLTIDAQKLSFKNEFDVVVSFFCFHWIPNQQEVFSGIAESLKENGQVLIVSIAAQEERHPLLESALQLISQPKWSALQQEASKHNYYPQQAKVVEEMLNTAGLIPVEVTRTEKIVRFASAEDLQNWLSAWMGGLLVMAQLPVAVHADFIHDLVSTYCQLMPKNKDNTIDFPLPLLITRARK